MLYTPLADAEPAANVPQLDAGSDVPTSPNRRDNGAAAGGGAVKLRTCVRGGQMELDILIRGGMVFDGTGNPWFVADVGIKDGKIAAVGKLNGTPAAQEIDARGLAVAPGFVDAHAHSDYLILADPTNENKLLQGVTLDV